MNKLERTILFACCFVLVCSIIVSTSSAGNPDTGIFQHVRTLSYNIYIGADIFAVIDPPPADILELLQRVRNGFDMVLETYFPARADAIANGIAHLRPDIVGLQEVSFILAIVDDKLVIHDYLNLLMAALQERGLDYVEVASNDNASIILPMLGGLVFLLDRDVILAKSNINILSTNTYDYANIFSVNIAPFPPLELKRGLVEAVAEIRGQTYRFVNTHLEVRNLFMPDSAIPVQELQAQELVTFLDGETVHPTILVGDLNALPEEEVNQIVVDSGFIDVWPLRIFGRRDPGFTCCQAEDLQNEMSFLDERIDFTYYRNGTNESSSYRVIPLFARVVGNSLTEKTATVPRLWPSDHGGVFSFLLVP
ncbi:MAG: endonuclease/exonuclease/phosphatase family protein [Planctomycetota bacterium]